jgi:hypothetical protein
MPCEIQIYRLTPEKGKYYMYAEYTRSEGNWPHEKYYTTNSLRYVGEFKWNITTGYRDNASCIGIFHNNGEEDNVTYSQNGIKSYEQIVNYSYNGRTCFLEVTRKINPKLKRIKFKSGKKKYLIELPHMNEI